MAKGRNPLSRLFSTKAAQAEKGQAAADRRDEDGKDQQAAADASSVEKVQAAASKLQEQTSDGRFDGVGQSDSDDPGSKDTPAIPADQTNTSGIETGSAGKDAGFGNDRTGQSDSMAAELDASAQAAFDRLASAQADLKAPSSPFEQAADSAATLDDPHAGQRGNLGSGGFSETVDAVVAGGSGDFFDTFDVTGSGPDGVAEHAADVVGQLFSGAESLLGDRQAGLATEIAIAEGLIADQNTRASSPSVADGALTDAVDSVTAADLDEQAKKAGVTPPSDSSGGGAGEAESEGDDGPGEPEDTGLIDSVVNFFKSAGAPTNVNQAQQLGDVDDGIGNTTGTQSVADASEEQGIKGLETAVGRSLGGFGKSGGGVKDPGSDPDLVGGAPTAAQIAFSQYLREQAHYHHWTDNQGSIDDNPNADAAGISTGPISDMANDNESLIGQPEGPDGDVHGGSGHAPVGGLEVDPLEGSAYSGPSRGGNPEDVDFGSATLPQGSQGESEQNNDDDGDSAAAFVVPRFEVLDHVPDLVLQPLDDD